MARLRKGVVWVVVVLAGWFTLQAAIEAELPVTPGNARHLQIAGRQVGAWNQAAARAAGGRRDVRCLRSSARR